MMLGNKKKIEKKKFFTFIIDGRIERGEEKCSLAPHRHEWR